MDDKEHQELHLASFRRLSVDMRVRCVEAIRNLYQNHQETQNEIVELIKKDPYTWWAPSHFFWGMNMRNFLRDYYTDDQLPATPYDEGEAKNWDDYAYGIVEVAFKEGIYHLLNDDEKI